MIICKSSKDKNGSIYSLGDYKTKFITNIFHLYIYIYIYIYICFAVGAKLEKSF